MHSFQLDHLELALEKRKKEGTFRSLKPERDEVDFYSNDYLGLAKSRKLHQILINNIIGDPGLVSGSTGSRLISGNSFIATDTESYLALIHQYSSALLFTSGYNANLALFSTLPGRNDTIIVDEYIHRSVHDGCTLSHAKKVKFRHNDLRSLEEKLKKKEGNCYVAIESLYSMEGDFAPLQEIVELTRKYSAHLIVDEAHAFGLFGYGLAAEQQLQDKILATVITYGKALGAHGAAILTNGLVKDYLINFASAFIYTTSAQDMQWMAIRTGYDFLTAYPELPVQLQKNIRLFRKQKLPTPSSENSPIQAIIIPDNQQLKSLQEALSEKKLLTYAVYSPTVKEGTERLRISLHSFNTEEEILNLTEVIKEFI